MDPRRFVQPVLCFIGLLGCLVLAKAWLIPPSPLVMAQTATTGDGGGSLFVQGAQVTIPGLTVSNSSPTDLGNPTFFTATIPTDPDSYTYSWLFGDGSTASGATVQHVYTSAGKFTAQVIVARGGVTDRRTTEVIIRDKATPPPSPTPSPSGLEVVCEAGVEANNPIICVATVQEGDNVVYTWDMGDNTPLLDGSSITHVYQAPGQYILFVTASNQYGSTTRSTTVTILDESITGLTFAPTMPLLAESPVAFHAQVESGTNVMYEWTWGDGDVVIGGSEGWHIYQAPGVYEISLRAWNSRNEQTTVKPFTIKARPPSDLQILHSSPQPAGSPISFLATVTSREAVTFTWDWGDGSPIEISTDLAASHTYRVSKKYVINVTATNSGGFIEAQEIVYVGVPLLVPEAMIQWDKQIPFAGQPIHFTACFKTPGGECKDIDTLDQYVWDFGDSESVTTTQPFAMHTYEARGRFPVSLVASGPDITKAGDAIVVLGHGLYFPAISRIGSFQIGGQSGSGPAPTAAITPTAEATATPISTSTPVTLVPPTATSTPTATTVLTSTPTSSSTPTPTPTPTRTPGGTIPLLTDQ